jgi:hypothetical protein
MDRQIRRLATHSYVRLELDAIAATKGGSLLSKSRAPVFSRQDPDNE